MLTQSLNFNFRWFHRDSKEAGHVQTSKLCNDCGEHRWSHGYRRRRWNVHWRPRRTDVRSQTVAAFHSLVGLSASAAAIGDYINCPDVTQLDGVHLASIYLATVIGSVTFTGSLVAFGKLDGRLPSAPMKLGARDQINMGLGAATLGETDAIAMGAPQVGTGRVCYK